MAELETDLRSKNTETDVYGTDIHLTTVDATVIYNDLMDQLESGVGESLYPGDERRIFAEAVSAAFVQLYNKIDDCGRQSMLQYARGEVLDAIGARLGVSRLPGSAASTTIRFSVQEPQEENIVIPKWTKVTADKSVYFATDEAAVIQAGAYNVEVTASATTVGESANGYAAGTLRTLVDLIPYISQVTNLTVSAGGDDGEPYTDAGDDRFRERIRLAPNKLSTAGPEQGYIYWALTADPSIIDVKAVSERETMHKTLTVTDRKAYIGGTRILADTLKVFGHNSETASVVDTDYTYDYTDDLLTITMTETGGLKDATSIDIALDRTLEGQVKIVPLLEGGQAPDKDMEEKILETVNASDVRPMTDKVSIEAPHMVDYDIELTYWAQPDTAAEVIVNVEEKDGAISRFNEWQTESLGRDINPDMLRRYIMLPDWEDNLAGAVRVEITQPHYRELDENEVAHFSGHLKVNHVIKSGVI